jgi:hypothetical protein
VRAANYESARYVSNLKTYKDRKHHETSSTLENTFSTAQQNDVRSFSWLPPVIESHGFRQECGASTFVTLTGAIKALILSMLVERQVGN